MRIEALRGLRSLSYSQQGIKQRNPLFRKSFLRCAGRAVYDLWDGPALLSELSEEAGGRCYEIDNSRDLPAVAEKIGRELRHHYILDLDAVLDRLSLLDTEPVLDLDSRVDRLDPDDSLDLDSCVEPD